MKTYIKPTLYVFSIKNEPLLAASEPQPKDELGDGNWFSKRNDRIIEDDEE